MMQHVQSMKAVISAIAEKHGLRPTDLTGPMRFKNYVHARQEAAYVMRTQLRRSYSTIGRALGNRDHTTIVHAVRAHAERNGLPYSEGFSGT